jgi:NAD(P)-dependent dehydrogenase (short-subunit alcohol dehydrogenase family)
MAVLLDAKVALITGAGSGIGRATPLIFAREGAKLMLSDIAAEGGDETLRMVKQIGAEALFVRTDVSKLAEVEALIGQVISTWGRIDCAFNNAGIDGRMGKLDECTEENWHRTLAVNLTGVFFCMKAEIPHMLRQGGGAIVNTASVAGITGSPGLPAYVASKHGVVGLTRAAALEYGREKIRVNCVCPGPIRTPMLGRLLTGRPEMEQRFASAEPLKRLGEPAEIGEGRSPGSARTRHLT